jgi:transposase-like protein
MTHLEKLEKIRELLTDRNIAEVSRRVDISRPTLYAVMKGNTETIQLATFVKLEQYFGLE